MTVSIIIVNWNSKELLRQCLLSIRATCGKLRLQIVVVDGGSFDGCAEMLAQDFPDVDFVQSNDNIGFGRANNLGFLRVSGDAVWLLNPDTVVRPDALETLLHELSRLPDAGIVSPRLLHSDGRLQWSVHALPKPIRQALDSEVLRRVLSPFGRWAPPTDYAPPTTVAVEAVPGTAMLLRRKTFADVGGFNAAYFMYAEDMDLCFKVRQLGLEIYHVPSALVVHHGGASSSTQRGSFSDVMTREALATYFVLNHSRFHAWTYRAATTVYALARLLVAAFCFVVGGERRRATSRLSIERWSALLGWSVGRQKWAKQYFSMQPADTSVQQ